MSTQEPLSSNTSVSPHSSSTPLITSAQRQDLQRAGKSPDASSDGKSFKAAKKSLLDLGRKKESNPMERQTEADIVPQAGSRASAPLPAQVKHQQQQGSDAKRCTRPVPLSPSLLSHQHAAAVSPSRLRSSSPRMHSPGNSEIFERNVQEYISISNVHGEISPAHIPTHVITEDSIPPALQASAQAITSSSLDPDDVEIVTSSSHQPAASGIEGSSTSLSSPPLLHYSKSNDSTRSLLQHSGSPAGVEDDSASSYGQLDPTDVRRLSFISFKDIVQSEHHEMAASALEGAGSRESLHIQDRAGSPYRLPRSPTPTTNHSIDGLTTPPKGVSINPIISTIEQSPPRSTRLGSPCSSGHGDLSIETMRQALRKTASGDLSGGRSARMSPVSDGGSSRDVPHSRTNT